MKIPKKIQELEQPEQMIRLTRLKEFKELVYPLSAREVAEMIGHPAGSVRNWIAGRKIPNHVFTYITRLKVKSHIMHAVLQRKTSRGVPVNKTIRTIIIKRLRKEGTEQAMKMLKDLGVR